MNFNFCKIAIAIFAIVKLIKPQKQNYRYPKILFQIVRVFSLVLVLSVDRIHKIWTK